MSTGSRIGWVAVAAAVAALGAAAAYWFLRPKPAITHPELTIVFSGDMRGRLTPCGCFSGQYGGFTRLASWLGNETNRPVLKVDVGDAIEGPDDYQRIQYRYVLRAFAQMGFAVLNAGAREAHLSVDQLQELSRISAVPLISANLIEKQTGRPVLSGWRVVALPDGRKVGFVGVLDPAGESENWGEGLGVEKMEIAIGRLLPRVKRSCDLLVLLAWTDEAGLDALADQFYEFNLILGGKVSQPSQQLITRNRSVILYTGNEARTVGRVTAQRVAPGKLAATRFEMVLLKDDLAEDESILALAEAGRREIRNTPLGLDAPDYLAAESIPGVKLASEYAGTAACLECHPSAGRIWQASGHAQAFRTLVKKDADADPHCLGCHTIGFGAPSGYRRELKGERLTDVGCESCHGPGRLHVAQQRGDASIAFKFRPLAAGDCQKCHHGEFSRPFVWSRFWPAVEHGKEPRRSAAERTSQTVAR